MKHGTTDLYQRKKKIPTFKICARSIGFASVEDLFNSHPHTPNHCAERSRHSWLSRTVSAGDVSSDQAPQSQPGHPSAERIFDSIIDAETGEILEFSKAKWNVGEGRVNLSTSNILAMGTGKLDIKARAAEQKRIHEQQLMRQEGGHLQQLDDNRASNAMSSSSGSKVQSVPVTPLSKLSKLGSSAFLSNRKLAVSPTLRESKKEGVSLPRQAQRVPISEFTNEMANDEANGEIEPNRERGSGSVRISVERTSSSPTTSLRPLNITESPSRSAKSDRSKSMYDRHPQAQNTSWRHPLITEYLMKGPLNPMHHIHWNPRTNSVLNVDEDGNAIDFRDPDMVELLDPSVVSLPTSHQQETSEVHSIGGDSVSHSEENSKSICSTLDSFGSSTVFSGDRHKRHRPRRGHQSNGLEMGTSLTGSPSSKSVVKTLPKDSSMELVDPVISPFQLHSCGVFFVYFRSLILDLFLLHA